MNRRAFLGGLIAAVLLAGLRPKPRAPRIWGLNLPGTRGTWNSGGRFNQAAYQRQIDQMARYQRTPWYGLDYQVRQW